jgi:ABC-2 type transport system ATP-binding protein
MIEVSALGRYFGEVKALDGLDFTVPEGVICGFLGPNGAGKSTTMRILATLDEPDAGYARIGGFDVGRDLWEVRALLGYMPDDAGSCADLMVGEYLDFFARFRGLWGQKRRTELERVIAFTETEHLLTRPVDGLSKGQRQRISLARALLGQPKVLLLDEPAAGLDPAARMQLREALKLLARAGVTVLISSHVLEELGDLIDHCVIIEGGRASFVGSMSALEARTQRAPRYVVSVLGELEAAAEFFLEQAHVSEVSVMEGRLHVSWLGGEAEVPPMLLRALQRGIAVHEIHRPKEALQDAYLVVTGGQTHEP